MLTEDRLFATLDAATRKLSLPGGEKVFLTDTVGFVRKLPHQLVQAFKSTLDVVIDADLLIHVVDASAHDPEGQIKAVQEVLDEIGADEIPQLVVFNKIDIADEPAALMRAYEGSMAVSAASGEGAEELLNAIADRLAITNELVDIIVPFDRGDIIAELHRSGQVMSEQATDEGMKYRARLDTFSAGRMSEFVVETEGNQ